MDMQVLEWNKETLRSLRLRMGWSKSELARHLHCSSQDVESWEVEGRSIDARIRGELEILLRQAEECSDEMKYTPAAENECDRNALSQIPFSRVKADLE